INFDLNVKNVNNVLKSLGGTKFLPEEIDNKTFTIKVPMVVQFYIGNGSQYLNITEAKSPEVIVPQDVDEEQLRLALLDLPIIPQRVRNQLAGINDWRNTLIVPNIEGSAEEVRVNGSEAVYIKNEQGGSLIWQENGVIYTIDSNLSKEEILKIAVEMR
ncbi:MAG TPA: DUF4367 domain-containing protein, partial [Clostridia bacterium]|nr:DUF4367 domain-containing protein [Clostridia bacterium]